MSLQTSLRTLARISPQGIIPDTELLARFAERRDDESFRGLVERHGPLVRAVCRRTSGDDHAAEDAFQAVFLTLARQAARIHRPEALPGWLYKVAHSCGLKARRKRPTLPANERQDSSADPLDRISGRELLEIVDAEIVKLPEAHRSALIVCTIEGLTVEDAAKRLKATTGAVRGWLERGRETLRKRLAARKLELSAVLVALSAASSCRLTAGQIELVVGVLNQGSRLIPSALSSLVTNRVSAAWTAIAATVVAGVIGGALMAVPKAGPEMPNGESHTAIPLQAPKVKPDEGVILFTRAGKPYLINPDGKNERAVTIPEKDPRFFSISNDGKRIIYNVQKKLYVRNVSGEGETQTFELPLGMAPFPMFVWSSKNDEVAFSARPESELMKHDVFEHYILELTSGKTNKLPLPKNHFITDWSIDGYFLTTALKKVLLEFTDGYGYQGSLHLLSRDGKTQKKLTSSNEHEYFGRISPDGKRVLFWNSDGPKLQWYPVERPDSITTVDLKSHVVTDNNYSWSPDSRRIAFNWRTTREQNLQGLADSGMCISDPDGSNSVQILKKLDDGYSVSWVTAPQKGGGK